MAHDHSTNLALQPGHTWCVCGGKLVAIGGIDTFEKHGMEIFYCVIEVSVWDPKGWTSMGEWSCLTYMSRSCCRACAVGTDGGSLVVMGGRDDSLYHGEIDYRKEPLDAVQEFDGEEETHMQIGPILQMSCRGMSGVVHDGVIYVMGGTFMGRSVWSANISDLMKPVSFMLGVLLTWVACS